jgi:hypothetical protein
MDDLSENANENVIHYPDSGKGMYLSCFEYCLNIFYLFYLSYILSDRLHCGE